MRIFALALVAVLALPAAADAAKPRLDRIRNIVVIYEENHSFDNLYGDWPKVDGVGDAPVARTRQIDQAGAPYPCLPQKDVNLASKPCSAFPTGRSGSTTSSRPPPRPARGRASPRRTA